MLDNEEVIYRIIVLLLNTMTIGLSVCILLTYLRVPRLRQNPGKVIIAVLIFQSFDSAFLMLSQFYQFEGGPIGTDQKVTFSVNKYCNLIGSIQEFITIEYTALNYFLVINLYLQLRNICYNFRSLMIKVHIFVVIISSGTLLYANNQKIIEIGQPRPYKPLGNCAVQDNSTLQKVQSFVSSIILIIVLALLAIICLRKNNRIGVEIYQTNTEKFQRKYLKQYAKINLVYSFLFIFTKAIPQCLLWIKDQNSLKPIYLLFYSLSSLLLVLIRLKEPVFKKYFQKYSINYQGHQKPLISRLLNNTSSSTSQHLRVSNIEERRQSDQFLDVQQLIVHAEASNDIQDIEVTYYTQIQHQSIHHPGTLFLSKQYYQTLQNFQDIFSKVQCYKIIASLSVILQQDQDLIMRKKDLIQRSFNFSYVKRILLNCNLKDEFLNEYLSDHEQNQMKNKASEQELLSHNPMVQQVYKENQSNFQAYLYGNKTIRQLCEHHLAIKFSQIIQSLDIPSNLKLIIQMSKFQHGTVFVSQDNLVTLDVITKEQKTYLTRGGGLLGLCNVWIEQIQQNETLLPLIVAVICFKFDDKPCINIVIRVNRLKFNIPRFEDGQAQQQCISQLLKSNVIGWITLNQNQVLKRFLAKTVKDGQFQIALNRQDFTLPAESKLSLIYQIKKDWEVLHNFGSINHTLQFLYFKFSSQRLMSIMKHQEKGDEISSLTSPLDDEDLNNRQSKLISLGQYDLQSHLGYVKVFWDDIWRQQDPNESPQDDQILQTIIQAIEESF